MKHLSTDMTRAQATPKEWLRLGAQIGTVVNGWAERGDIVAYVGPGAGGEAPACFKPTLAEVEVNVDIAFGKINPESVGDFRERAVQFDWPRATGALFHEALHARFSRWDIDAAAKALSPQALRALMLLEESRIEKLGVEHMSKNTSFLRACAIDIVLHDLHADELTGSRSSMAQLAALISARVDAGVLLADDVREILDIIEASLGTELLAELRSIWLVAQAHINHTDVSALYPLAERWAELTKDDPEEGGESGGGAPGEKGEESDDTPPSTDGKGSGSSTPGTTEDGDTDGSGTPDPSSILDALENACEESTISASDDLADQQTAEEWEEIVDARHSAATEARSHREVSERVFAKTTGPGVGSTRSRLESRRPPKGPERAAAVRVAQLLEKAKYRDRSEVEISSVVPPGRLRTRAVVQGAAFKSKGIQATVEPWRRTVRKHTDDPTLTVGVMVDISGSMGGAMEPMAVTAWVMSEATKRVQGRAAMVYYGSSVFPTLKPGQHLDQVHVYSAPDMTEKFDDAFKALDGALDLLHGTGPRLLVIVSDGYYTPTETNKAKAWMKRCDEAGVAVLWLPFDSGYHVHDITDGTKGAILPGVLNPATAATEIGAAAAAQLTAAGAAR